MGCCYVMEGSINSRLLAGQEKRIEKLLIVQLLHVYISLHYRPNQSGIARKPSSQEIFHAKQKHEQVW